MTFPKRLQRFDFSGDVCYCGEAVNSRAVVVAPQEIGNYWPGIWGTTTPLSTRPFHFQEA